MRFSKTNSRKIHTSLITVAVLKVPESKELIIKDSDCVWRYIRAFGNGGQSSNKTESGVIVKHLPTGIEAKSTSDRSQHENKILAMDVLRSRLFELEQSKHNLNINEQRQLQGSGHRSDKVRTLRVLDNTVKCEKTSKIKPLKDYLRGHILFD